MFYFGRIFKVHLVTEAGAMDADVVWLWCAGLLIPFVIWVSLRGDRQTEEQHSESPWKPKISNGWLAVFFCLYCSALYITSTKIFPQ